MPLWRLFCLGLVYALVLLSPSSRANAKPFKVAFEYSEPTKAELRPIADELRRRRVLERFSQFLTVIRWPRPFKLQLDTCEEANAYYEDGVVHVCYEYIQQFVRQANGPNIPPVATPNDLLIGATIDLFLHEVGHAVFDMFKVPVLGREEDAADQFSAYILLQFGGSDAQRLMRGAAFGLAQEAQEEQRTQPDRFKLYANEHGTPGQRFFNYVCLAYGYDPRLFAGAVNMGRLTKERAEGCSSEYAQVRRAFERLIRPHIDQRAAAKIRRQSPFRFDPVAATDGSAR